MEYEIISTATEEGRAQVQAYEREQAAKIQRGQQIYAQIKRTSKYYGQTAPGALFPVFVVAGHREAYVVQGGPGGQYRLADVNLFVVANGREMRIS